MLLEIKIPSPGESITEVEIGKWLVENGAVVKKDLEIAEVESDKATFSLSASAAGTIKILVKEGERVSVGSVACTIDTEAAIVEGEKQDEKTVGDVTEKGKPTGEETGKGLSGVYPTEEAKAPEAKIQSADEKKVTVDSVGKAGEKRPEEGEFPENETPQDFIQPDREETSGHPRIKFTAAAKAVMDAEGLSINEVLEGLHRLTRQDVETVVNLLKSNVPYQEKEENKITGAAPSRIEDRNMMSPLRRKLSQRLVAVKNETAMLTTFNEIDMLRLMQLRTKYQKSFTEKYGIKLGYMSFFTKAASIALAQYPLVNSMIDGEEIVSPHYQDIGIAVQTEKGLVVPIIRDAESKSIPELEREIFELAEKARNKKLTIQEMTGGTFTITNGGLFGSLLSTPIINPPQSAILGMHAIKERPVVVDNKVEIRPMMYVALTYDHRLIDGKVSVSFLYKIKQLIENPSSLLFQGKDPEDLLLGL